MIGATNTSPTIRAIPQLHGPSTLSNAVWMTIRTYIPPNLLHWEIEFGCGDVSIEVFVRFEHQPSDPGVGEFYQRHTQAELDLEEDFGSVGQPLSLNDRRWHHLPWHQF